VQARANSGSIGHGKLRARYCISELKKIMVKEATKTKILCSETQISAGKLEVNPTSVAPSPNETNRAGSAQQTKVLKEVNKLKNGRKIALLFSSDCFNAISSIL
jgi:hypothetical protein